MTKSGNAILTFGRACFAIALIGFGVQFIIYRHALTTLAPAWPVWIPANPGWAYLVASLLMGGGAAIFLRIKARTVSIAFGVIMLGWAACEHLPKLLGNLSAGGEWVDALKAVALAGGALIVASSLPEEQASWPSLLARLVGGGEKLIPAARFCLGIFLIVCGIEHFVYARYVAPLVPSWIPWAFFWIYFAGVALIAGGLGLMISRTVRLSATLVGIMIFIWFAILHVPRAITAISDGNEWTSVFQALGISGAALILGRVGTVYSPRAAKLSSS
jgi:uncharacterized membrane protein YphA (DoxX/SURF4 family)